MKLTRQQKRKRQRVLSAELNRKWTPFEEVPLETIQHPQWMTRLFKNNHFLVMVDDKTKTTRGYATRAFIRRNDSQPIEDHWNVIQAIKNQVFGEDVVGVEYYPRNNELVNDHNIYWLFIYPEGVLPLPIIGDSEEYENQESASNDTVMSGVQEAEGNGETSPVFSDQAQQGALS